MKKFLKKYWKKIHRREEALQRWLLSKLRARGLDWLPPVITWRAILNAFGFFIVPVFMYALLRETPLDNRNEGISLALQSAGIWALITLFEVAVMWTILRPFTHFLRESRKGTTMQSTEIVAARSAVLSFPLKATLYSFGIWIVFAFIFCIWVAVAKHDNLVEGIYLFISFWFAGGLNHVILYYLDKQEVGEFERDLLGVRAGAEGRSIRHRRQVGESLSIPFKLGVVTGILIAVGLGFIGVVSVARSSETSRDRIARFDESLLSALAQQHQGDMGGVRETLADLQRRTKRKLMIMEEKKLIPLFAGLDDNTSETYQQFYGTGHVRGGATGNNLEYYAVARFDETYVLVSLIKPSHYISLEKESIIAVFALAILGIVFTVGFTYLTKRDVSEPLQMLSEHFRLLAAGHLTHLHSPPSEDEIGHLTWDVRQASTKLLGPFRQMNLTRLKLTDEMMRVRFLRDELDKTWRILNDGQDDILRKIEAAKHLIAKIQQTSKVLSDLIAMSETSLQRLLRLTKNAGTRFDSLSTSLQVIAEEFDHATDASTEVEQIGNRMITLINELASDASPIEYQLNDYSQLIEDLRFHFLRIKETRSKSTHALGQLKATVKENRDAMLMLQSAISEQSDLVRRIDHIIGIIHSVTNDTRLLALNAAIIAAQGGSHDREFNVISDEIKELAERTGGLLGEITGRTHIVLDADQAARKISDDAGLSVAVVEQNLAIAEAALEAIRELKQQALPYIEAPESNIGEGKAWFERMRKWKFETSEQLEKLLAAAPDWRKSIGHSQNELARLRSAINTYTTVTSRASAGITEGIDVLRQLQKKRAQFSSSLQTYQRKVGTFQDSAAESNDNIKAINANFVSLRSSMDLLLNNSRQLEEKLETFRISSDGNSREISEI